MCISLSFQNLSATPVSPKENLESLIVICAGTVEDLKRFYNMELEQLKGLILAKLGCFCHDNQGEQWLDTSQRPIQAILADSLDVAIECAQYQQSPTLEHCERRLHRGIILWRGKPFGDCRKLRQWP